MKRLKTADSEGLATLIGLSLVAAIFYVASAVLIPIALAVMLNLLLAPLVTRLQRIGVHRVLAILATVILAFSVIGLIGWMVVTQVVSLAEELPKYEETLRDKVRSLRGSGEPTGVWGRAGTMLENLAEDLEPDGAEGVPSAPEADGSLASEDSRPIPVEIHEQRPTIVESFGEVAQPFVGPAGTAGLVVVFVIAMLFQRENLRERVVQLVSGGQLNVATEAIDDGVRRISRYLTMQLLVNAAYGIPIGIGLYFIGIPNAFLWGFLAILLRFIPYLGPWLAAAFPLTLAVVVDPGWSKLFMTLGLFLVIELLSNNVLEPWLYGASTGISNFALMVAAVFWTWLWGPVGLFLSTPLTVCLVVIGTYVPALKFISVLLGSGPVLEPDARLYQRMLAMDYAEMLALAREYVKHHGHTAFYDQVLIPALSAAETDRHDGTLAEVRQQSILENTRDLIEALDDRESRHEDDDLPQGDRAQVLIVPAKDDIDEVAGMILLQRLAAENIPARLLSAKEPPEECLRCVKRDRVEVVCISAVPPSALAPARESCRKLLAQAPDVHRLVAVWSPAAAVTDLTERLKSASPDAVVTKVHDAVQHICSITDISSTAAMQPPAIPENESERLAEIERLDLLNRKPDEVFDGITKELARVFEVPISLVSIIDTDRQFWKSHTGLPPDLAAAGESSRETSVCGHVVALNEPLIIEDVIKDSRFANNPFLVKRGIRFYAGVPLRTEAGTAVGSLCVIDTKPRKVRKRDIALLTVLADRLMRSTSQRKGKAA